MAEGGTAGGPPPSMAGRPLFVRWLERVGFGRLAGDGRGATRWGPLTGYAVAVVAVGMVAPQVYNLATGRPVAFVQNPLLALQAGVLVAAGAATESLHRRYDLAVDRSNLVERTGERARFEGLAGRTGSPRREARDISR